MVSNVDNKPTPQIYFGKIFPNKLIKWEKLYLLQVVHELIHFLGSSRGAKQYGFLLTSGCLLSRKVLWTVQIGSFWPKLRYFTDQTGPNEDPK